MPVKWTSENDQLLFLTLLKTHEVKVDTTKIAAHWPAHGEGPSARAITERLQKIRKDNAASGSVPSTPQKSNRATPTTPGKGKAENSAKRKRGVTIKAERIDDDDESGLKVSAQELAELGGPGGSSGDEDMGERKSKKRVRTATKSVVYESVSTEDGESGSSEFEAV